MLEVQVVEPGYMNGTANLGLVFPEHRSGSIVDSGSLYAAADDTPWYKSWVVWTLIVLGLAGAGGVIYYVRRDR